MSSKVNKLYILMTLVMLSKCSSDIDFKPNFKWPTVIITVLVRNKAHTLPYFLTCLRNQEYPKDRISIWMYSDYNQDQSNEILVKWTTKYGSEYNEVNITANHSTSLNLYKEKSSHWSPEHFKHVINLREEALAVARKKWADFIFMIDGDVFLTNPLTLKILLNKDMLIVSPMLLSDGLYSNFWCGMTDNYYYKRTEEYKPILNREVIGCFTVPMIHTAVLINLKLQASDKLFYEPTKIENYTGPEDDIIAFAVNAKQNGIPLSVCNDHLYGFVPVPLEENDDLSKEYEQLLNVKLEAISRNRPLLYDPLFEKDVFYPDPWKFGCDEIYMINLERRTERRELMERSFKELGMEAKLFKAVDGRNININDLTKFSVTLMPNYEDPYHKRPMKAGEVGCFLSHYYIWEEIIEKGYQTTLVLEDDIHFVPYFRHKLLNLLKELKELEWDLVYVGRKILLDADEVYVTRNMVRPLYSYWTLGYLISQRGASKLIAAQPLSKMLPVDEFLPIMFDQHPNDTWKAHFSNRNLVAYSAAPLLVHPTHYVGQDGYVSDTEDSDIVLEKGTSAHHNNEL